MKISSILVAQPKPETERSPYFDLASKYKIKIDFIPFTHVESVVGKEFRKERVNILEHHAIIMTSRNAIDHFFRVCSELRINVPETMKYFCPSEAIAYYLQKYVVYRKRKIFHGVKALSDIADVLKKHKEDKFLFPCSDTHNEDVPELLKSLNINFSEAVLFRTVSSNLSKLAKVNYDMLVFFSPNGIRSLFDNFPKFKQNQTKIAAFGVNTAKAVIDAGLKLNLSAPTLEAPSMPMAIELFIKNPDKAPQILLTKPELKPVVIEKPKKEETKKAVVVVEKTATKKTKAAKAVAKKTIIKKVSKPAAKKISKPIKKAAKPKKAVKKISKPAKKATKPVAKKTSSKTKKIQKSPKPKKALKKKSKR